MSRLGQAGDPATPHLGGWVNENFGSRQVGEVGTYCPDVWDFLAERLKVRRYLDIGCGVGASLRHMKEKGIEVVGVEGDRSAVAAADESVRGDIILHDYNTGPAIKEAEFDLCYSAEFVEHVGEKFIRNFLLDMGRCRNVLITHAGPGQGGHHHVNCRQGDYWVGALAAAGFRNDEVMTEIVRALAGDLASGARGGACCWFGARSFLFFSKPEEIHFGPDDRIVIRRAEYGSAAVKSDVTNIVAIVLASSGGHRLEMRVGNEALGGDPVFGQVKTLTVHWSLSSDLDRTYTNRAAEGSLLVLEV